MILVELLVKQGSREPGAVVVRFSPKMLSYNAVRLYNGNKIYN